MYPTKAERFASPSVITLPAPLGNHLGRLDSQETAGTRLPYCSRKIIKPKAALESSSKF